MLSNLRINTPRECYRFKLKNGQILLGSKTSTLKKQTGFFPLFNGTISGKTVSSCCPLTFHQVFYWKCQSLRLFASDTRGSHPDQTNSQPLALERQISNCRSLEAALSVYDRLINPPKPTLEVFKTIITRCLDSSQAWRLKDIWKDMERYSIVPDYKCFHSLLVVCQINGDAALAKKLFEKIKNGQFDFQVNIFDYTKLIQSLNSMEDSMEIMKWMEDNQIKPNAVYYIQLLKQCGDISSLRKLHSHLIDAQIERTVQLDSQLVSMYMKFGSLDDALSVFNGMRMKDAITWSSLISGYVQNGNPKKALEVFEQMQREGIEPDHGTYSVALSVCAGLGDLSLGKQIHSQIDRNGIKWDNSLLTSLLNMYAKCGSMDDALSIFHRLKSRDVVSWTALISGYQQNGKPGKALDSFMQMQKEGIRPNYVTYLIALSACGYIGDLSFGKEIHSQMEKYGIKFDIAMQTTLMNMYAKCGSMEDALSVFRTMKSRDVVSWTALISGYGQNGQPSKAFALFEQMQKENIRPNSTTFLALLSACSRSGLADEALICIKEMKEKYKIPLELVHYKYALDTLGRAGRIRDAENIINKMEKSNVEIWKRLLKESRFNREISMSIAENLLKLNPNDSSIHQILSEVTQKREKEEHYKLEERRFP